VLFCRSDYAYGKRGQGAIPPDASLNFDCELINFMPKKKEKWEYSEQEKEVEALRLKEEGNDFILGVYLLCNYIHMLCVFIALRNGPFPGKALAGSAGSLRGSRRHD
jgi:hypothetical protein